MSLVFYQARDSAADVHSSSLTLVIERFVELDNPEGGFGDGACWGDYEFEVTFDGETRTSPEFSIDPGFGTGCLIGDRTSFDIGYEFEKTVDPGDGEIPLSIGVTDVDTFDDEVMDVSPLPEERILELSVVDPYLGGFSVVDEAGNRLDENGEEVSGAAFPPDATSPVIEGDGDSHRGGLEISISSASNDLDGDGLLDSWEADGIDVNDDGDVDDPVDLDLPSWGADPRRRDLFLELDTANGRQLGRDDVQAMKNAFAAAPVSNPDGTTGINLWVDTGGAVDPVAQEGQALGTCSDGMDNDGSGAVDAADTDCVGQRATANPYLDASVEAASFASNCQDGIDNDGDGLADGNDGDCVVGDDFGGGNAIGGSPAICNLNAAFYTAKGNNFAPGRQPVFRYAISTPGTSGCGSGGQAEIGGNDFVDHNGDGGTIMHELGHTLSLRHGGFNDNNCKPNHPSVMNYFNQFGVGKDSGGVVLDYAPPRQGIADGARSTDLPDSELDEADLSETTPVDATDSSNRFVFTDGTGTLIWNALDSQVDWNGQNGIESGDIDPVNVDTSGSVPTRTSAWPSNCTNSSTTDTHEGANEWELVTLPFREFGDAADAPVNPVQVDEITREELRELFSALHTADTAVTGSGEPDPVAAGATLTLDGHASNTGPNPADAVRMTVQTPDGVTPASLPADCVADERLTCSLGSLARNATDGRSLTLDVASDLVHEAGGPRTLEFDWDVSHVGPELDEANNHESTSVTVVAEGDLSVQSLEVTERPPMLVVGEPASLAAEATVANDGPSSPMDADVTFDGAGTGVNAEPHTEPVDALSEESTRTVEGTVEVTCTEPGIREIAVTGAVSPAHPHASDPDEGNNELSRTVTVNCAQPVAIDIAPGDPDDPLRTFGRGNQFAAVLTTGADEYGLPSRFDASWIEASTVRLGARDQVENGDGLRPRFTDLHDVRELGPHERGRDGDRDLRLRFMRNQLPFGDGDEEACLLGRFEPADESGPLTFVGCDTITVESSPRQGRAPR